MSYRRHIRRHEDMRRLSWASCNRSGKEPVLDVDVDNIFSLYGCWRERKDYLHHDAQAGGAYGAEDLIPSTSSSVEKIRFQLLYERIYK